MDAKLNSIETEPNRGFHPVVEKGLPHIFIDSCVQIWPDADFARAHQHGVTAYAVTAWRPPGSLHDAIENLLYWHLIARQHSNIIVAETVQDIYRAREEGQAALILAAQDGEPIGGEIHRLEAFHRLGLRMLIPAYNRTNLLCDGCLDRTDGGLTYLGLQMVEECNRLGIVLDCSHVGRRASLEMIDESAHPVVFSHSNPKAIVDNPRNIDDEQIKACAARGGVIGLVCWGPLIYKEGSRRRTTVEDFLEHVDYVAQLLGNTDHIGLGTDFSLGSYPLGSPNPWGTPPYKDARGEHDVYVPTYARSRQRFADGLSHYGDMESFIEKLEARGFKDEDIRNILGGNFLRVFEQVW